MTEPVLYEERDDIAIITINRPEKKNTLTDAVIQGIADGVDAATASPDAVAIVVRGSGDTLTAGYDLTADGAETADGGPAGRRRTAPEARTPVRVRGTPCVTTSSWATTSAGS